MDEWDFNVRRLISVIVLDINQRPYYGNVVCKS